MANIFTGICTVLYTKQPEPFRIQTRRKFGVVPGILHGRAPRFLFFPVGSG